MGDLPQQNKREIHLNFIVETAGQADFLVRALGRELEHHEVEGLNFDIVEIVMPQDPTVEDDSMTVEESLDWGRRATRRARELRNEKAAHLGQLIGLRRKKKKLSRADLAKSIGVREATLLFFETGLAQYDELRYEFVVSICRTLEVHAGFLCEGAEVDLDNLNRMEAESPSIFDVKMSASELA